MRQIAARAPWALMLVLSLGLFGCSQEETLTAPADRETGLTATDGASGSDIVDTAIGAGAFNTLVAAVQAADLEGALRSEGPFTVFAPTDEAFAALPEGLVAKLLLPENKEKLQQILLYHVVSGRVLSGDLRWFQFTQTLEGQYLWIRKSWGGTIRVNNARVLSGDVLASNGVIHIINTVLIPPGFQLEGDQAEPELDIVDTAVGAGTFTTLVAAVQAAGLEGALRGEGPLTVFAPSDEAFAKLPPELVGALLLPENSGKLQQLLLYHVVAGRVLSSDLQYYQRVSTLAGSKVTIVKWFQNVWVNRSRVTAADVLATNGVIHVINRVLIPPDFAIATSTAMYDAESLESLIEARTADEGPPTKFDLRYVEAGN